MTNSPQIDLAEFLGRTGNLLIHLLDKCNLRCKHCYLDASKNGKRLLPLELVRRTIEEVNELGIKQVQFTGGEPFLYPHFSEVLQFAKRKVPFIVVSTNGTLIDEKVAKLLSDVGASVVTSIDGPPHYHDLFRGKEGSFTKTQDGVARLIDNGVSTTIVTTVCNDGLKHIDWCAEWAHKMNADTILFQPLEKIGRGVEMDKNQLPEEKLNDLFIHLNDLAVHYAPKNLQVKMTFKSRDFMIAHPCAAFVCNGNRCHRGVEKELKKLIVREDGEILPELVDIDMRFAIGNLYNDTLKNNIISYLSDGYASFDRLCRDVYKDTLLNYPSPLIPWSEILTERSRSFNG